MAELSGRDITPMELAEIGVAVGAVLLAAVDGDGDKCAAIVTGIGVKFGHDGVGLLCCGLANAIVKMTNVHRREFVPNELRGSDGRVRALDDLSEVMRPVGWAYRYVEAWAASDITATWELFRADLPNRRRTLENVAELVNLAGFLGQQKRRQKTAKLN